MGFSYLVILVPSNFGLTSILFRCVHFSRNIFRHFDFLVAKSTFEHELRQYMSNFVHRICIADRETL